MFSTSHLYVATILDEKLSAAAAERLAPKSSTPSLKARLDSVAHSAWSLLSGPAERPITPTLTQYPYRG